MCSDPSYIVWSHNCWRPSLQVQLLRFRYRWLLSAGNQDKIEVGKNLFFKVGEPRFYGSDWHHMVDMTDTIWGQRRMTMKHNSRRYFLLANVERLQLSRYWILWYTPKSCPACRKYNRDRNPIVSMVTSVVDASDDDAYCGADMALHEMNEMNEMELHDLTMTDMFNMVDNNWFCWDASWRTVSPLRLFTLV